MRKTLEELIDAKEPAWPKVKQWIDGATHQVDVLETSGKRGSSVLLELQVTTRSPLGALAFGTGGLLIDHGWVRVLGGGCSRLEGDLARWNGLGPSPLIEPFEGAMFVAHDALGGFFALDGGALGDGKGAAFYLAPDTLEWQHLAPSYSNLLVFLLQGDLQKFYADLRWPGWEKDVEALAPDRGFHFHPPLFADAQGVTRSRADIPMPELLGLNLEMAEQLLGDA